MGFQCLEEMERYTFIVNSLRKVPHLPQNKKVYEQIFVLETINYVETSSCLFLRPQVISESVLFSKLNAIENTTNHA